MFEKLLFQLRYLLVIVKKEFLTILKKDAA